MKTPEEQAAERYPDPNEPMAERIGLIPDFNRRNDLRTAYATCIRERVEPLEAEIAKLLAQIGELITVTGTTDNVLGNYMEGKIDGEKAMAAIYEAHAHLVTMPDSVEREGVLYVRADTQDNRPDVDAVMEVFSWAIQTRQMPEEVRARLLTSGLCRATK
jgi:hypothetical protein